MIEESGRMKVDFNNLRKQLAESYNKLIIELNRHIQKDKETFGPGIDYGDTFCVGDIYDEISEIRSCIATLICLYDEKENIKCIDIDLELLNNEDS